MWKQLRETVHYQLLVFPGPFYPGKVRFLPGDVEVNGNGRQLSLSRWRRNGFGAKKGYWEYTAVESAKWKFARRFPSLARSMYALSRPFETAPKYKEIWSPWLIKTNGMWVEQAKR